MPRADDAEYCECVARRAVARAALHLGIEEMTEEALHVLSLCLLEYLGRIGSLTGANAEASGRSTSHCNVLDAIRAVEFCTSPSAINGGSLADDDGTTAEEQQEESIVGGANVAANGVNGAKNQSRSKHPVNSWKSLAQFCFGVDWDQEPNFNVTTTVGGRGIGRKGAVDETVVSTIQKRGGWSAPFPEEIPFFPSRSSFLLDALPFHSSLPTATTTTPNLDSDGDQIMAQNAVLASENRAEEEVKLWGIMLDASAPANTSSRAKNSDNSKKRSYGQLSNTDPFLPQFYPPIPSLSTAKKIAKIRDGGSVVTMMKASDNSDDVLLSVRAALVVPPGRPAKAPEPKAVVPLARASNAPVSRILEGSMDPSQP